MTAPPRKRSEGGFTLIELLVGLALLSMAAALMLAGISGITAMTRRAGSGAADDATVAAAQIVLRDRLERLQPVNLGDAARPVVDMAGSDGSIDFSGPPPPGAGFDALQHYRLTLTDAGDLMLYRLSSANDRIDPRNPAVSGWTGAALLRRVHAISLSYYGDAGRGPPQWQSVWRQRPAPPSLVRLRVSFAQGDRRVWPALIVRPAASLPPPACAPDDRRCGAGA